MESLYRKYRPLTFESVVGQGHIVSTLEHAVTEGRLSHAYLFCGPRGTGKTTMARILAKALLCKDAAAARETGASGCMPDGTCEECRAIAEGTHPDVYELDAASRTGVDNVREEIIGSVNFAPVRGAYKVYIIDEVHMLTTAAFNALLKTLEEPPSHVVFVMCTTDPQKIPETILSRCQRFDFHRIGNDDIVHRLAYICDHEGFSYDTEALDIVAKHARGGMRDALSTLEQLSVFGAGSVRVADARALLGEVSGAVLGDFARAIAARDAPALFSLVREQVNEGGDLMELTRDLVAHLRDVYMVRVAGAQTDVLDASPDEVAAIAEEAALFEGPDRLARILTVLDDAALEMRAAPDTRLVLEIAFTRLARPESDLTLEALAERLERLEARLAAGIPAAPVDPASLTAPATPAAPTPAATPAVSTPATAPTRQAAPAPVPNAAVSAAPGSAVAARPVAPTTSAAATARVAKDEHSRRDAPDASATSSEQSSPKATAPAVETAAVSDAGELQRRWAEVVKRVTAAQASRGALLQSARALADDGDTLTVGLPAGSAFALRMLGREDTQSVGLPQVAAVFGNRKVAYTMGDAATAPSAPAAQTGSPSTPAAASSAEQSPAPRVSPSQAPAPVAPPSPAPTPESSSAPRAQAPSTRPAAPGAGDAAPAAPAPSADQTTGPTIVAEPTVEDDRRAWEDDVVPYDDDFIASYEANEDLPPFEPDVPDPAASAPTSQRPASAGQPGDDSFVPFSQAASAALTSGSGTSPVMPAVSESAETMRSSASAPAAPARQDVAPPAAKPAGPAFTPTSEAGAMFAAQDTSSEVPQSEEAAKELLSNIFGTGVVFKDA